MPKKAPTPCTHTRCRNMAVSQGRCASHPRQRHKSTEQAAFYNSTAWKQLRARVRREEPICRLCQKRPTASVDHEDGDYSNNARSNLRGLCVECERSRTGRQHQAKRCVA